MNKSLMLLLTLLMGCLQINGKGFPASTLVKVPAPGSTHYLDSQEKPIRELSPGDKVFCYTKQHNIIVGTVTTTSIIPFWDFSLVHLKTKESNVLTHPEQTFLFPTHGWLMAHSLLSGIPAGKILYSFPKRCSQIHEVSEAMSDTILYNIMVEPCSNFFVTSDGLLTQGITPTPPIQCLLTRARFQRSMNALANMPFDNNADADDELEGLFIEF